MLLRNCQWFCTKDTKLLKFSTRCTKLPEGFVVKLRNSLQFSELKKVLYENYETFFMLRNLKSFRKTVLNLQSSVEHLFFFTVYAITKALSPNGELREKICRSLSLKNQGFLELHEGRVLASWSKRVKWRGPLQTLKHQVSWRGHHGFWR